MIRRVSGLVAVPAGKRQQIGTTDLPFWTRTILHVVGSVLLLGLASIMADLTERCALLRRPSSSTSIAAIGIITAGISLLAEHISLFGCLTV